MSTKVCVVGGGPAGLRAAEVASVAGAAVFLFDTMPSVGRKFLVAGRGGLNITNTDTGFAEKYSGPGMPPEIWSSLLEDFSPDSLRAWVEESGIKTVQASSGRVYPEEMKSAPLLRRWIARLRSQGVRFFPRHRWTGWREGGQRRWLLDFQTPSGGSAHEADAVVFALGGGSWPITGSDGAWQERFSASGIAIHTLIPANCGWETDWPQEVLTSAEGKPLKNIRAHAGGAVADGELMITSYGLEGGAIYPLGPALRETPVVLLDFKPSFSFEALLARMPAKGKFHLHEAFERCRIQETARVLLLSRSTQWTSRETFAAGVKGFSIHLNRPRPIAEAISSAGGVCWSEIDENMMLKKFPGIFVAGEMVDWEAPTGGYLIQGCFCTGTRAGAAAANFT